MGVIRRPVKGRLTPGEPLGDRVSTVLPVQAPADAGVGLEIPERGDRCCVQDFAVQRARCDHDDPDPTPLAGRRLRVPGL